MILSWQDISFIKLFHICGKMDSSMNIVGCRPNSFEHESLLDSCDVTLRCIVSNF